MKKLILSVLIVLSISVTAKNKSHLTFKVDERTELASIVCNLAGIEEYYSAYVPYQTDIDRLSEYADHRLIGFVKQLNQENAANVPVLKLANLLLEFRNNEFQRGEANPQLEAILFSYISAEQYETYIELLNSFYKDANMSDVFKRNEVYFMMLEKNIIIKGESIDLVFFEKMFGMEFGEWVFFVDTEYPIMAEDFKFTPVVEVDDKLQLAFYDFKRSICSVDGPCYISYHGFMGMSVMYVLAQSWVKEYARKYEHETLQTSRALYAKNKNLLDAKRINAENIWCEYVTNVLLGIYAEGVKSKNVANNVLNANMKTGLVEYEWLLDYTKANFTNNRKQYPTFQSFLPALAEYYVQLAVGD